MKIRHDSNLLRNVCLMLTALLMIVPLLFKQYARTQQDDVSEAIVRSYLQSSSEVVFLSVETQSPFDTFMHRFDSSPVPVRTLAQGIYVPSHDPAARGHYIDAVTKKKGYTMTIERIGWRGPLNAQVLVGVRTGHRVDRVTVARASTGWVVTQNEVEVIE